jgi:hypothetical protein
LDTADRATVDEEICAPDRATGVPAFDGLGDRQLVAELRRLVAHRDPGAVVDRRGRAEADRHVSLRPAPDTMGHLSVLLPAAQGVAVWATLTRADTARHLARSALADASAAPHRVYATPSTGALASPPSRVVPTSRGEIYLTELILAWHAA